MDSKMDSKAFYKDECLRVYKERNYPEARKLLIRFFEDYKPDTKQRIIARLAMATSLIECLQNCDSPENYATEFNNHLEKYLSELKEVDITGLAPNAFLDYFALTIKFSLIMDIPGNIQTKVLGYFRCFVEITSPKMQEKDYLDIWVGEIDNERRNFARPDHIERSIILAEALLGEIEKKENLKEYRVGVNKILADVIYFYHFATSREGDRAKKAIAYLNAVLEDSPNDLYAETFKKDINKFSETSLQIHRFHHDSNTRLGSMHVLAEKITGKCPNTESYYADILGLNRQLNALRAITMLVKDKQPAVDDWQTLDPAQMLSPLVKERKWPEHCIISKGESSEWIFWPEYTALVFENLMKNSVEAYGRNSIDIPEFPCEIRIFYQDKKIEYLDFAGGIDLAGDIFEPYRSSKGVVSDAGLGLTQARKAMELQNYKINLAQSQPENGVLFIIDFNKKKKKRKK